MINRLDDETSILKEITSNNSKELTAFFKLLFLSGKELKEEYDKKLSSERKVQKKELERIISRLFIDFQKIEKILFSMNTVLNNRERLSNVSKEVNKTSFNPAFYKTFNGIDIEFFSIISDDNEENLKKSDESYLNSKNTYLRNKKKIEKLIAKKHELEELKLKIESHIIMPFNRKRHTKKIKQIETMINEINKKLAFFKQIKDFVKNYESLSSSQKLAIIEYRKLLNDFQQLYSKYSTLIKKTNEDIANKNNQFLNLKDNDNKDFWYTALSRMFKKNNITVEYLNRVFQQIEIVRNNSYDINQDFIGSEREKLLAQVVKFFLNNIYYDEKDIYLPDTSIKDTPKKKTKKIKVQ